MPIVELGREDVADVLAVAGVHTTPEAVPHLIDQLTAEEAVAALAAALELTHDLGFYGQG